MRGRAAGGGTRLLIPTFRLAGLRGGGCGAGAARPCAAAHRIAGVPVRPCGSCLRVRGCGSGNRVRTLRVTGSRVRGPTFAGRGSAGRGSATPGLRVRSPRVARLRILALRIMALRVAGLRVAGLRIMGLRIMGLRILGLRVTGFRGARHRGRCAIVPDPRRCPAGSSHRRSPPQMPAANPRRQSPPPISAVSPPSPLRAAFAVGPSGCQRRPAGTRRRRPGAGPTLGAAVASHAPFPCGEGAGGTERVAVPRPTRSGQRQEARAAARFRMSCG